MNYETSLEPYNSSAVQVSNTDNEQLVADHMDYRGYSVDFYRDTYGKQLYAYFDQNRIDFGTDNTQYKDDYKKLVDNKLDTISRFPKSPQFNGARLTWFDNGGFRDIKLIHWNRILKVWLVANPGEIRTDILIFESERY